ncbi:putative realted to GPI transamidase component S (Phosphatidyl inositol glycan class S) [Venustampulla echinocandica]|uniref:Putative realted to GPI transamidase component S (Phosphatidyl inositol glycan class S) n=1 Tax=Venustampulla echinocandica TaxID=2656787 RepID=A0A370TAP2_9HELO|nr:putative realted to GPI transamidase component S (Phosphatidyl inositol glycan class S) [Venustampulla echinocandica]RDL31005.1 putative realted to GPI transamidase component S (Phosphatidyl inositol glycan class S) [Venustampulla echinocandica]
MSASSQAPPAAIPESGVQQDDDRKSKNGITAPDNAVSAMAKKEPPPEKPAEIRLRRLVILSFWLIILFLGLPIWWRTTTIYRARLPLDQMMDWAEGRACRPVFPLRISIEADFLQDHEAQHLLRTTQHALDDLNDFSAHHLRLQLSPSASASTTAPELSTGGEEEEVALVIRLLPGNTTIADLQSYCPILDIYYTPNQIPSSSSSSSSLATYIANTLRELFAEEQAMIAYLLSTSSAPPERSPKALAPEVAESLAKWTTRSMKYSRTYHLTFSLFTPNATPSSWDIEAALEAYMKPLLESFSSISNFTIDTQVQLYATPGVSGNILKKEDLSGFINAAEWPLSPSIGGAPTVNFIVYVGDMEVEGGGKSWLIPQWGGVVVQSDISDLRPAMLIFSNQLMSLLGAPESGSLPLRLMTLVRVRSAGLLLKASGTMGSLARLTLALPSISIPRSVADGVYTTVEHLRKACDGLGGKEGLENARIAEEAAEKAFFEKSMVGQVYFPDEHKVAVYMPLLGPVGVPLVMGVVKEIKAWRKRKRMSK